MCLFVSNVAFAWTFTYYRSQAIVRAHFESEMGAAKMADLI